MPATQNIQTQPLITFIVTTYNLPLEMLRECLTSITSLSLSKEQREIIVIDDGSDTSLVNSLTEIADDIIYLWQPNRGLSEARNMGLRIASGQFIQFVDGDDSLIQPQYEHCIDIVRYHEPVDMVMFYGSKSKDQPLAFTYEGPMTGTQYMKDNNVRASAWGYIFRANRLGNLRFRQGILHEDEEFTPQLILLMHNIYTTPARAYFYRQRKGSITHSKSADIRDRRLNDSLSILLHLRAIAKSSGGEKKAALDRRVAQLSMDYLVNVIRLTRDFKRLNEAIDTLSANGLYPLPNNHYTRSYSIFCALIKKKIGRGILMTLL